MRLLVKLEAAKDCSSDLLYHHKLQGFIYSLLRNTEHEKLHDKKGYKFFCFSNIFPTRDMKKGEKAHLIVSSPNDEFVKTLWKQILQRIRTTIHIGDNSYNILSARMLQPHLPRSFSFITGTPIIIRIPNYRYGNYGIKAEKPYKYVYWKPKHSFEAFIKQLEENLIKKYNEFNNTCMERMPIFERFIFKKTVCNHIIINGKEVKVFGSVWQFMFDGASRNPEKRKLLRFALDTGLGELNSLGFGFVNVIRC
ncbi:MAG: CRISPR-associated endoribonuclease Cas6 [Candidatus Micrarchaeia archaeon]